MKTKIFKLKVAMIFGWGILIPLYFTASGVAESQPRTLNNISNSGTNSNGIFACRIGSHNIYLDKDVALNEKQKCISINVKITNALIEEAARRYNISDEPELTQDWDSIIAYLNTKNSQPVTLESLPNLSPRIKDAFEKKSQELSDGILSVKVENYIVNYLIKTDKDFGIYFAGTTAVQVANMNVINEINQEGALKYRAKKINEWWINFIATMHTQFDDEDCYKIFQEFKERGLMKKYR